MIVKDGLEDLKRLAPMVEPFIDEWVVVMPPKDPAISWAKANGIKVVVKDLTQTVEPDVLQRFKDEFNLDLNPEYRLFNFAKARNLSLEKCKSDYVLWLDADDTPHGLDNMQKLIRDYPDVDVFDVTYDYFKDEEGNSVSDHIRERLFKNNGLLEWKGGELGLIHETALPKDNTNPIRLVVDDNIMLIEHKSDHQLQSSNRNYVALAYEYVKTNGSDPRTTYYLGIELFNRSMFHHCISILKEYVARSGWDEEKYHAYLKIAEAYRMLRSPDSSINAYLVAIKELPNYPHAYLGLGEVYHEQEDWARSTEFILTGLQKNIPKTKYVVDKTALMFRPCMYVALNYLQLGKPKDAYQWFMKGARINPAHQWVGEHVDIFEEAKDLDDYVRAFVKLGTLSKKLYPKTLGKLAEVVPDELMDQEILMNFKWSHTIPKIWSAKSIVFFCSSAFEEWGPESLEKGCGGSEEAIIQLSKRLAGLGWEVVVYNNCIREQTKDGVKWVRYERFNPRDMFNVLVCWRNNVLPDVRTASQKYIDMHDVPMGHFYGKEALGSATVLVKSQYHRSLFVGVPDEQFRVIPNGVVTEQFKDAKKVKNNLVWTSSYDRGLENLLEMWADVKKSVPDATLDVYYGFNLFDNTPWGQKPEGRAWKAKMLALLDQDGITDHGRVGSDVVAEAYKKADVWAYPTRFPEIDCITATKAMAAGCVPIATDYAVMKERNQGIMIEGDIETEEVKQRFKNELIALLKDDKRKEEIRSKLDVSQYDWEEISKQWDEEFNK